MNKKRLNWRLVIAMLLAFIMPGLGRSLVESVWGGIGLYLLFLLLCGVEVTTPGLLKLLNTVLEFSIWLYFVSIDIAIVRKAIEEHYA